MSTPDLSLLLTRTAAGDREALRAIYESMRQPVYLYVLVQCGGNRPLAEDVLQDTFIGIWESAPRYQPTGSASSSHSAYIVICLSIFLLYHIGRSLASFSVLCCLFFI